MASDVITWWPGYGQALTVPPFPSVCFYCKTPGERIFPIRLGGFELRIPYCAAHIGMARRYYEGVHQRRAPLLVMALALIFALTTAHGLAFVLLADLLGYQAVGLQWVAALALLFGMWGTLFPQWEAWRRALVARQVGYRPAEQGRVVPGIHTISVDQAAEGCDDCLLALTFSDPDLAARFRAAQRPRNLRR